jgi:hypothetical protein
MREVLAPPPRFVTSPLHWVVAASTLTICSPHGFSSFFQRREAIEYVFRLAKSPDRRHKALAAKNLPTYYERTPDRREELHEAIYDLCEDAEPEVRVVALKPPGFLSQTHIPRDILRPSHHT